MNKIVLASQSPRRRQLLEWAEVPFEIVVKETAEDFPPDLAPSDAAVYIARQKALAVRETVGEDKTILAADTIVVLDGRIIGKPTDRLHAIETLQALSGRQHEVITGVVLSRGEKETCFADVTNVWFYELSNEQIEFYVDKYKPFDKAGAYAIQEWVGVVGIKSVDGDFYNVMGLPVSRVVRALNNF